MNLMVKASMMFGKLYRKLTKFRLRPIKVFCFHQVSELYNPLTMWECDWTQLDQFKSNILRLKEKFKFISMPEAYDKIKNDRFRFRKYAVLTADDGYHSMLNVLPWLEEQKVPIALFVNTKYLDKKSWSAINEEQAKRVNPKVDMLGEVCPDLYMSLDELFGLKSSWVTVGMHGHEHLDATKQSGEEFRDNVEKCKNTVSAHPRFIPYYAYTWGKHNELTDEILMEIGLIPVLVNGMSNFDNDSFVNRICIDGKTM